MDLRLTMELADWTGVVRAQDANRVCCLAHGQSVLFPGHQFEEGQKVALYDVKTTFDATNSTWVLSSKDTSILVPIPDEGNVQVLGVKDLCAGMGGITQGLEAVGYHRLAAMDVRPLMCETLSKNGHLVIQGDVLSSTDRARLHALPYPARCTLTSGFPCQPLSSQGDRRGAADDRAQPFFQTG